MKIVSFNVNGLRSRLHQLEALINAQRPEIIALQETKVRDEEFPVDAVQSLGYHVVFHGQKTHYGVALLSRLPLQDVQLGLPGDGDEAQKRFIAATIPLSDGTPVRVINGYFPQGENRDHAVKFPAKQRFYAELLGHLQGECDPATPLVVLGDFNVAPRDMDLGIGTDNVKRWLKSGKCCFLPEERLWFECLIEWGLHDSFRELNPAVADRFSWFDYRSRGFEGEPKRGLRIDHILLTRSLLARCRAAGIDYDIRSMAKPSDHCPVWVEIE
ncbi:exodeoxyribonuclease III [Pelobacter propionicus]|uniref:Exodeoxyribonuclease III n=1 Tax=Pelobacter propionicus (strain DSM 2379 / NBRC 103807 / OttBd1) TaxID=338966 RepID=A1API2_PELPD|nr:exodeoxyribonuclease III [Pelobacter propionicus]ABK99252.1 Exodeoxyribonuclease III [Pelobacter propionicus DSM 2379]